MRFPLLLLLFLALSAAGAAAPAKMGQGEMSSSGSQLQPEAPEGPKADAKASPKGALSPAEPLSKPPIPKLPPTQRLQTPAEKTAPHLLEPGRTLPAVQKAPAAVRPRQIGPAGGMRVPTSGRATPLAPGLRPHDAQLRKQGAPPLELQEGIIPSNESARADLEITEMKRLSSGAHRGQIAILVKATPVEAGKRPPQESFPIRLKEGDRVVWEGRGRIRNMLFGFGDQVVARYVLGSREITLTAEVNFRDMNRLYPESCPRTTGCRDIDNRFSQTFNSPSPLSVQGATAQAIARETHRDEGGDFESRVTGVRVARQGPSWQVIEVSYDLHERDTDSWDARHRLQFFPIIDSGTPRPGSDAIRCETARGLGSPRIMLPPSRETRLEIFCRLQGDVTGPFRAHIVVSLQRWDRGAYRGSQERTASRSWTMEEGGPDRSRLPDFVVASARIRRGSTGKPATLEVIARNAADFGTTPVPMRVEFVDRIDGVVASRDYEMPMGGGRGELLVSLADGDAFEWRVGDLEHQTGFIRVKLNHRRGVVESDHGNNELQVGVVDYYPRRR